MSTDVTNLRVTTPSSIFYRASCWRCGDFGDGDGIEFQPTPKDAIDVALNDLGFTIHGREVLCGGCTWEAEQSQATPDPGGVSIPRDGVS